MSYERFSQLWDALVTNRPRSSAPTFPVTSMQPETALALIEYGQGNKSKINQVRALLGRPAL